MYGMSMSLIDCIALWYQLTNFQFPFAERKAHDKMCKEFSIHHQDDTPVVIYQIPQLICHDQGYVHEGFTWERGHVISNFF